MRRWPLTSSRRRPTEQYQFTHNLIRMTLYDELRPARRRLMHRIVGHAVEVSRRADIDAVLPELARHFHAAGDINRAIDYATRAGQRADALLAFEDAVQFFQAALDAMEQRPEPDDAARCRLLFLLGEAQRKANDYPRALATLRDAAELATALRRAGAMRARGAGLRTGRVAGCRSRLIRRRGSCWSEHSGS